MKAIKQHLISLFIFLALMFGATAVLAEEETSAETNVDNTIDGTSTTDTETVNSDSQAGSGTGSSTQEEKRDQFEANQTDRQVERKERRSEAEANQVERKEALSERTQERIINLAANISNRMDAVVIRMQNILDRINSRIEKLADREIDTTEAKSHVADAQDAISAAKTQLESVDSLVNDAVYSENPRVAWQTVKTEYLAIKENLKSGHTSLRLAVSALKMAIAESGEGAGVSDAVRNNETAEVDTTSE